MQIYIKTLTGLILTFNFESSDTIETIKSIIEDNRGIPVHQQKIIFGGREVKNNETLFDLNVQPNSTVYLILNIKG